MPKMTLERGAAVALALALVLGIAVLSFAEEPEAHWAQDAIDRWSALAPAMADPDEALTLGEAAAMFDTLLGRSEGEETGEPDTALSQAEYYAMLCTALRIPPEDAADVLPDPAGAIDRGSALSLLDRAMSAWVSVDSAYAEAEGGLVVVSARDAIVTGTADSVLIAGGTRDSAVTLENLTVSGGVDVACPGAALLLTGTTAMEYLHVGADAPDTRIYIGENAEAGELRLDAEGVFVAGRREDAPAGATPPVEMPPEEPPTEEIETLPEETLPEEIPPEETPPEEAEEPEMPEEKPAQDAPAEEEEEPPVEPADPVEAVGPGVIVDYATGDEPYRSYEVNASRAEEEGAAYDVLVEVKMTGLEPHLSRGAGYGWWSGFAVTAPAGATGVTVGYSHDGATYGTPVSGTVSEGYYAHYFDALRWNEYYIRLQWSGAELSAEWAAPTTYKLDFTGVEPDLSSLTEPDGPFGKFGAAGLTDLTEGTRHKDTLYQSCDVVLTHVRNGDGGYLELTVRAEGLESHRTAAGAGYWVGFSVTAPDAAGSYRYSAYLSAETARNNFAKKAVVPWESFSADVDGAGAYGIVQRTNAAQADQRDYWAVLQWYADEAGATPLTAPEVIHIVIDASLA